MNKIYYLLLAATVICSGITAQSNWKLDPTFNTVGFNTYDFANFIYDDDVIQDIFPLPDGKAFLCGESGAEKIRGSFVIKINQDGSTDNSYGNNGIATVFSPIDSFGVTRAWALLPSGKILCAGDDRTGNPDSNFYTFFIQRISENGTIDTTFGNSGLTMINFSANPYGGCSSILPQPDGTIICIGIKQDAGAIGSIAICRLTENGELDESIGAGGKFTYIPASDPGFPRSAQAPSGKIYLVENGWETRIVTAFDPTCFCIDSTFGSNGSVISIDNNSRDADIAVFDGKIYVVGKIKYGSGPFEASIRSYNSNGSINSEFGGNGDVFQNYSKPRGWERLAIQPDGKLLVVGQVSSISQKRIFTARFLPNGTVDSTFGDGNGFMIHSLANDEQKPFCVSIQGDGKILVGGFLENQPAKKKALVLRLFEKQSTPVLGAFQNRDLKIWPTVSDGQLFIERMDTRAATAEIFNQNGQQVGTFKLATGQSLCSHPVDLLPAGTYFLKLDGQARQFFVLK